MVHVAPTSLVEAVTGTYPPASQTHCHKTKNNNAGTATPNGCDSVLWRGVARPKGIEPRFAGALADLPRPSLAKAPANFRRSSPGHPPQHRRREQTIAREIPAGLRPGNAGRGATGGEKVGQRSAVPTQHTRVPIDRKAALGVEQRAGHPNRLERRRQRRDTGETASEPVGAAASLEAFDLSETLQQGVCRQFEARSQLLDAVRLDDRAAGFGLPEILELARDFGDPLVENIECNRLRLGNDGSRLLGIAEALVGEPQARGC